ncbi:MAG TPA: phytanoyl-CoA dioxygenase family protein [Planctomycetota bacterium]|nr:phytanoyl-CoA dioxygenase family protein [Planctomycetota bacterium]
MLAPAAIQDQITEAYDRDGYYVAHKMLSAAECEALKVEAMRVLKEKAKPGSTVYVGCAAASEMYYKLASDPRIVSILDKIMPQGVAFMSDKFVFKSGEQRFATPWHTDNFYWPNTRAKLSVWIALDRVHAENGALKVVRGSHKKSWRPKRGDMSQTNGEFGNVVDATQWSPEDEVICEIEQGGAIFFSDNTVHGSCTNTSGLDRYAIISTYHAPVAVEEEFDKIFPAKHDIIRR